MYHKAGRVNTERLGSHAPTTPEGEWLPAALHHLPRREATQTPAGGGVEFFEFLIYVLLVVAALLAVTGYLGVGR